MPSFNFTANAMPADLVEFDTLDNTMTVMQTYIRGPWTENHDETLAKVYKIVRFLDNVPRHNEYQFWRLVSQRMCRLGIHRDPESCKERASAK